MGPDSSAFVTALFISFIDQIGDSFTEPVRLPLGCFLGASLGTIAWCATARGIGGIISVMWLPRISEHHGRKFVLVIALLGRCLGFFLQGIAFLVEDYALILFILGCGIAGLFAGSAPVLSSYVTEISGHNKDALTRRFMVMQISSQVVSMLMKPIAGALATFGLQLPFFFSSCFKLFGCLWALFAFEEAKDINISGQGRIVRPFIQNDNFRHAPAWHLLLDRNILLDKVILLCSVGFFCLSIVVSSLAFLIPVMIADNGNGLHQFEKHCIGLHYEPEEDLRQIALFHGLASIPFSLCTIFVSSFVYMPAAQQLGELPIFITAGLLCSLIYSSVGFWIHEFRFGMTIIAIQAVGGICLGFLRPMVGPLIGRYSNHNHRTKMAVCQAIPIFVGQLAGTLGWNIMVAIIYSSGVNQCWVSCGVCMFAFTGMLSYAFAIVEKKARHLNSLTSEQRKMLLKAGGDNALHPPEDIDDVINSIVDDVRKQLNARRGELWNGTAQFLYQEALQNSLKSKFRAWSDATQGREYLQDMHIVLCRGYPAELEEFQKNFPHIVESRPEAYPAYSFEASNSFVVGNFTLGSGSSVTQNSPLSTRSRISYRESDGHPDGFLRSRSSVHPENATESLAEMSSNASLRQKAEGASPR